MTEQTFDGKTQAEWLALHERKGNKHLGFPTDEKIQEALLWFEEHKKRRNMR